MAMIANIEYYSSQRQPYLLLLVHVWLSLLDHNLLNYINKSIHQPRTIRNNYYLSSDIFRVSKRITGVEWSGTNQRAIQFERRLLPKKLVVDRVELSSIFERWISHYVSYVIYS
jgi:hypothetical protein